GNTGLNSLRRRSEVITQTPTTVVLRTVDEVLRESGVCQVDFIKLDVEGGEAAVLKGVQKLLDGDTRPVIFCEVLEETTCHWDYPARKIIMYLVDRCYRWFEIN